MVTSTTKSMKSGKREGSMRQLNALDSMFLYLDTAKAPMTGGFLQIYAPEPKEDAATRFLRLNRHVERSLDASPVFRRALVRSPLDLDHAWFADDVDVDMSYHLRHYALPAPGSSAQLNDAYARICAQPMDLTRPLWEIHVIEGLDAVDGIPAGAFALIVKFHHAGFDGGAAADMVAALHRTDAKRDNTRIAVRRTMSAPEVPTLQSTLTRTVSRYARFGTALGRELAGRLPSVGRMVGKRALAGMGLGGHGKRERLNVPRTMFNNVTVSSHRTYTHLSLGLDEIAAVRRHAPGATINDVYLAAVGGALRRYLLDHGKLPKQSLIAACTVNVRSDDDRGQGGNQASFIRVPLGTDESHPARRLQKISEASAREKAKLKGSDDSADEKPHRKPTNWPLLVPAPLLVLMGSAVDRMRVTTRMAPPFNLCVTNVPGPRETLYLDGHRLLDFSGAPMMMHGFGIMINATSYDGALQVAIQSCRKVVSEDAMATLRQYLIESFAEVRSAVDVTAAKPAAGTPRSPKQKTAPAKRAAAKHPPARTPTRRPA